MNQKLYNAIYGFIVGDAVGVPYEFKTRGLFTCNDMRASTDADFHFALPLGAWSDDTSLMLCVLDALSVFPAESQMYGRFRKNAIDWWKIGKFTNHGWNSPYDIGNSCRYGLIELQTGKRNTFADLRSSNGNGGLMRIPPLALIYVMNDNLHEKYVKNDNDLMRMIHLFNRCSHNHEISNVGCLIYIRLAEQLLAGREMREALHNVAKNTENQYKIPEYQRIWDLSILNAPVEEIKSSGFVVDTLEAAIWCCAQHNSYSSAVLEAVNLGDDTDTVAALTGFLAGIYYNQVPDAWVNNIPERRIVDKLCTKFEEAMHG